MSNTVDIDNKKNKKVKVFVVILLSLLVFIGIFIYLILQILINPTIEKDLEEKAMHQAEALVSQVQDIEYGEVGDDYINVNVKLTNGMEITYKDDGRKISEGDYIKFKRYKGYHIDKTKLFGVVEDDNYSTKIIKIGES